MSDKQKKGSPYIPRTAAVPVRRITGSLIDGPVMEAASTQLDGCPGCQTKRAPSGRLEVIASVPLCTDCGDAWLAYVASGSDRPGATSPTAQLSARIARYVALAIRFHKRRVAGAVAAALADGRVKCRHMLDVHEPCTCGSCASAGRSDA